MTLWRYAVEILLLLLLLIPRLFILYTADLEDHVVEHGVSFHAFADDTQLCVHCRRWRSTSRELHRGSQPLDVCQPSQAERRQNGAALCRVTSWSGSAGERWSVLAAWN